MDSALEKVGLYDFFGVFLTGMLSVVIYYYVGLPVTFFTEVTHSDIMEVLFFLLESYFVGLVLQEASSAIEKSKWTEKLNILKILQFRKNARSNFLNPNNSVVENTLELQDYQSLANRLLQKEIDNDSYTADECEYVYYQCKTYIELQCKSDKASRINSLYGMSRSFLLALPIAIIVYLINNIESLNMLILAALVFFIWLFYRRSKRFSEYKVRVILRQYKLLH